MKPAPARRDPQGRSRCSAHSEGFSLVAERAKRRIADQEKKKTLTKNRNPRFLSGRDTKQWRFHVCFGGAVADFSPGAAKGSKNGNGRCGNDDG